jgi:excisionase family DNA binding protein
MGEHDLLTVDEVATHLRVTKPTVIRMIKAGTFEAVKPGRAWRIKAKSYEAFLQSWEEQR